MSGTPQGTYSTLTIVENANFSSNKIKISSGKTGKFKITAKDNYYIEKIEFEYDDNNIGIINNGDGSFSDDKSTWTASSSTITSTTFTVEATGSGDIKINKLTVTLVTGPQKPSFNINIQSTNVNENTDIVLTPSEPVTTVAGITPTITLTDSENKEVLGNTSLVYDGSDNTKITEIKFTLTEGTTLKYGETYTVNFASAQVQNDNNLQNDVFNFTFTVRTPDFSVTSEKEEYDLVKDKSVTPSVFAKFDNTDLTDKEISSIEWTCSYKKGDETIATFNNGIITGTGIGTATIEATAKYQGITASTTITYTVNVVNILPPVFSPIPVPGVEYTSGETLTVTISTQTDGDIIYYTTDNSDPSEKNNRNRIKDETGKVVLQINKTTIINAVTCNSDETVYSDIISYTYPFDDTAARFLKDGEAITPGKSEPLGRGDEIWVKLTWGDKPYGESKDLWTNASHDTGDDIKSAEFNGFTYCTVPDNYDALCEPANGREGYDKGVSCLPYDGTKNTHNEFDVPISGAYLKFEPKVNGTINVVLRQNGGPDYDGTYGKIDNLIYGKLRKRIIYVCDETGKPLTKTDGFTGMVHPNSKINKNFFTFTDSKIDDSNIKNPTDEDKANSKRLLREYIKLIKPELLKDTDSDNDGYPDYDEDGWTALGSKDAESIKNQLVEVLNESKNEVVGYHLITRAYVRYSFPVKAGKTYFIMGNLTKVAPCGYSFWKDAEATATETLNIKEGNTAGDANSVSYTGDEISWNSGNAVEGKQYNVKLDREFKANIWTTLVLPFSVSTSHLQEAFGTEDKKAEIMHFNYVDGSTLMLRKHYHQMIQAGIPVLIKPTKDVISFTFNNVTLQAKDVIPMTDTYKNSGWKIDASYLPATIPSGGYFIGYNKATGENKIYLTQNGKTVKGMRAWFVNDNPTSDAKLTSISFDGIEDETTGIEDALVEMGAMDAAPMDIYNINGQLVLRNATDTSKLPKGIYIVNGKKVVIK